MLQISHWFPNFFGMNSKFLTMSYKAGLFACWRHFLSFSTLHSGSGHTGPCAGPCRPLPQTNICWISKRGWVWKSEKQGTADKPTVVPLSSFPYGCQRVGITRFQAWWERWNLPKAAETQGPQSLSSAFTSLLLKQISSYLPTPGPHRSIIFCLPMPGNTGDSPSLMIHLATRLRWVSVQKYCPLKLF